jgi:membrane associated rhomboid family serine protease
MSSANMVPLHEYDRSVKLRVLALALFISLLWFVRAIDSLLPDGFSAAGVGIVPRTSSGLEGIVIAPFVHANWDHLIANSLPLAVLGALILLRGLTEFIFALITSVLISGLGTWVFGEGNAEHIGASGVILGFIGFLLFRCAFDRRLSTLLITLIVAILYGAGVGTSLIPDTDVSWSGHFFGFVGGFIAARLRYQPAPRHDPADHPLAVLNFPSSDEIILSRSSDRPRPA